MIDEFEDVPVGFSGEVVGLFPEDLADGVEDEGIFLGFVLLKVEILIEIILDEDCLLDSLEVELLLWKTVLEQ